LGSEKRHAIALVGIAVQSHPDHVNVVGHQAISGTEEIFARRYMKEQFAKRGVVRFVQPAAPSLRDWHRPMNNCIALIEFTWQSGQVEAAIKIWRAPSFESIHGAPES
jgi:hypothetical protein